MSNSVIGMCNVNLTVVLLQVTKVDFQKASTNEKQVRIKVTRSDSG